MKHQSLNFCLAALLASSALVQAAGPAASQHAAADPQSIAIVDAANTFLATLDETQQQAVVFDFADATQRINWSNFPQGGPGALRLGMLWGDMDQTQRQALVDLLDTILSPEGVNMALQQVAADEIVAAAEDGGSSNGRPPVSFGSAFYFVSFLGEPSTETPWMLQFGGHHLAINATVVGPNVTLSPSLTGGQPLKFTDAGAPVYIVEQEATQAAALLNSFTSEQLAVAVISDQLGELQSGPGEDGIVLDPEGLAGADMTTEQQAQFVKLIAARLGMLNADDAAVAMAAVQSNLDQTTFAWYGPKEPIGGGYFRVTGPTVLIEFSPQSNDGDATDHAHNMYRDPTNEYGAAWAKLD